MNPIYLKHILYSLSEYFLNLDTFLGDPSNLNKSEYEIFGTAIIHSDTVTSLKQFHDKVVAKMGGRALSSPHNLKDFVRVFKFSSVLISSTYTFFEKK